MAQAADPNAESALEQALKTAGGSFTIQGDPENSSYDSRKPKRFDILSSSGTKLATVLFQGSDKPVNVTLPDGRLAMSATQAAVLTSGALNGTLAGKPVTAGYEVDYMALCKGTGNPWVIKGAQNEVLLKAEQPARPWILPFILATFCMGVCCLMCCPPKTQLIFKKDGKVVGQVENAGKEGSRVVLQDDTVLKEMLLVLVYTTYYNAYMG